MLTGPPPKFHGTWDILDPSSQLLNLLVNRGTVWVGLRQGAKGAYYGLLSNLKCLCRLYRRLKTFGGSQDTQLADGTGIRLGYPLNCP
jgi:hypothetical protein